MPSTFFQKYCGAPGSSGGQGHDAEGLPLAEVGVLVQRCQSVVRGEALRYVAGIRQGMSA